jgi:hypothetical protein
MTLESGYFVEEYCHVMTDLLSCAARSPVTTGPAAIDTASRSSQSRIAEEQEMDGVQAGVDGDAVPMERVEA